MIGFYFESDSLKELSNRDFIKKHFQINEMSNKAMSKNTPSYVVEQIKAMKDLYEKELQRRYEEDLIDDDEIEDYYEEFEEKNANTWR